ncbi:MAG: hypothetical protein GWP08_00830 [Nitrospiraceae bacterium]|nr:hypothetical protein [Nitrospiraceae bacterium]
MALFMDEAIQNGEFPLWNPLTYCGMPFAANPQSYAFYPPNLIRSLLTFNPSPMNTHIGLLIVLGLHILLGGVSTFFFAREHRLGFGASLSAALVFIFSATFVRRVMAMHLITTIVWLPLILLLLRRAFIAQRFSSRMLYAVAAGTAFGMAVLAGFPQVVLYMAFAIIGYGAVYRVLHIGWRDFRLKKGLVQLVAKDTTVGVTVFVIGALLAAAMLIPGLEVASFSERSHLSNAIPDRTHAPSRLLNLFVSYIGSGSHHANYRLAGLGAIMLALAAFAHPRRRDVIVFTCMFLIMLDLALGPPLPFSRLLLSVAPFKLKDLTRAFLAVGFPLAMLVGFGVDAVAMRWQARDASPLHTAFFVMLGVFTLKTLHSTVEATTIFSPSNLVLAFPCAILVIIALAGGPFRRDAFARLRTMLSRLIPLRTGSAYVIVSMVLAALVFGEIYVWANPYVGYLRGRLGYRGSTAPLYEHSSLWSSNYRGADRHPNKFILSMRPSINGYDPLYIERVHRVLKSPHNTEMSLRPPAVLAENHRGNLFLKRSFWLARQYVAGPLPGANSLFPAATTVFLQNVPGELPVPEVASAEVIGKSISGTPIRQTLADESSIERWVSRRAGSKGGLYLSIPTFETQPLHGVLAVRFESNARVTIESFFREKTSRVPVSGKTYRVRPTRDGDGVLEFPLPDFREMRISLSVKPTPSDAAFRFKEAYVLYDSNDEDARISILRRRPNTVDVQLSDLPEHRILTFLDSSFPGWKAFVDNEEVPILLANDAFKAIVVPPGTHRVRFAFGSRPVYTGILVSTVTLLAICLLFGWAWRRHSPSSSHASCEQPEDDTARVGDPVAPSF